MMKLKEVNKNLIELFFANIGAGDFLQFFPFRHTDDNVELVDLLFGHLFLGEKQHTEGYGDDGGDAVAGGAGQYAAETLFLGHQQEADKFQKKNDNNLIRSGLLSLYWLYLIGYRIVGFDCL